MLVVAALTAPELMVLGDGLEEVPDVESSSMQPEGLELHDDAAPKEVVDVASSAYDDTPSPMSPNGAEELVPVVSYDAVAASDDADAPSKVVSTQMGNDDGYEDDTDTTVIGDKYEDGMDVNTLSPTLMCDAVHPKLMTACLQSDGKCVASQTQCDELGGAYNPDGCGDQCACCASLQPMRAPSRPFPIPSHPPKIVAHAGALSAGETPSPTITKQQVLADAPERPRYSMYLRLASLLVVLSIASNLAPAPTNPLARTILSPLTLVFDVIKFGFFFLATCCCTFGDGIAEPRPPAPIGMKAMPIRDVAVTERLRRPDAPNSTDALLADAELEDYEVETDEEEGAGENNPFKKRT